MPPVIRDRDTGRIGFVLWAQTWYPELGYTFDSHGYLPKQLKIPPNIVIFPLLSFFMRLRDPKIKFMQNDAAVQYCNNSDDDSNCDSTTSSSFDDVCFDSDNRAITFTGNFSFDVRVKLREDSEAPEYTFPRIDVMASG